MRTDTRKVLAKEERDEEEERKRKVEENGLRRAIVPFPLSFSASPSSPLVLHRPPYRHTRNTAFSYSTYKEGLNDYIGVKGSARAVCIIFHFLSRSQSAPRFKSQSVFTYPLHLLLIYDSQL
jgi:hypothetical protein